MQKTRYIVPEVFILLTAVVLGFFLYFYKLNTVPLYIDEATTGYNAYSLSTTGRDEYGKSWPTALRFLGSYSPPLYTYLTTLAIKVNGLNIESVRLISAILGLLMIFVVFIFLKNLKFYQNFFTPVLTALFFAISPWNMFFARTGYEIYLGFFTYSLGALFVWLGFKSKIFIPIGFAIFSLSTYTAHTERLASPLFFFLIVGFFRRELFAKENRLFTIIGLVIALIEQIPNLKLFTTPAFATKNDLFYSSLIVGQSTKIPFLPDFITYPLSFIREFFSQLLVYFSPRSLFFLPDPDPQRSLPELSVFYPWMIIPYVLGLAFFWAKRKLREVKYFLLLAVSILVPVSLANDPFSTQRALPLLLPLIVIISCGIDKLLLIKPRKILFIAVFILVFFSLVSLWRSYFVLFPIERAKTWGYGFEQLTQEIKKRPEEMFVIDQSRTKPTYIELAFFLKYPPEKFQQETDRSIKNNYYTNTKFDSFYRFANIETRNIKWESDIYKDLILVGDGLAVSEEQTKEHFLTKVFEIKDPTGQIVFRGFKTNPKEKCAALISKSPLCTVKE